MEKGKLAKYWVYKNTRQLDFSDPKHKRIKLHRSEDERHTGEKGFK
jgi:hypothetical protein